MKKIMFVLCFPAIILSMAFSISAQPAIRWSRIWEYVDRNSFSTYTVAEASDGGIVIGGCYVTFENEEYDWRVLIKMNEDGEDEWSSDLRPNNDDRCALWIETNPEGGYFVAGDRVSAGSEWLEIYDGDGRLLWSNLSYVSYGGTIKTVSGDILHATNDDISTTLYRYDAHGELIWERTYQNFTSYEILETEMGFILFNSMYAETGMMHVSSEGDSLAWYSIPRCDFRTMTMLDSGLILTLINHSSFILMTTQGEIVREYSLTLGDRQLVNGVTVLDEGGAILFGSSYEAPNNKSMLIKINSDGDSLWSAFYDIPSGSGTKAIVESRDGGLIIAGGAQYHSSWLIKTEPVPETVPSTDQNRNPKSFSLSSPFPNPFNSTTTIGYSVPVAGNVSLAVFDISGREVARLVDGAKPAGTHEAVWTADGLASGVYVVKLDAGGVVAREKVVLVR